FAPETVFLHGHTHVPRGETLEGFSFWNPGSMTLPKRGYPRSYAVYEDGLFRVLDFEGQTVLEHRPSPRS
ncbi:MAG: metallophosphoesterase family protein, partial [Desulfovibrio sp.]|nr:metallophosphoesterase family protein [Desulfovibrio sp.]